MEVRFLGVLSNFGDHQKGMLPVERSQQMDFLSAYSYRTNTSVVENSVNKSKKARMEMKSLNSLWTLVLR